MRKGRVLALAAGMSAVLTLGAGCQGAWAASAATQRCEGGAIKKGRCVCPKGFQRASGKCIKNASRPEGPCGDRGAVLNNATGECVCPGVAGSVFNPATKSCGCPPGTAPQDGDCRPFGSTRPGQNPRPGD